MTGSSAPIIVGYDGSVSGARALRWAMREADVSGLSVHVVHVVQWPATVMPGEVGWLSDEQRNMLLKDIAKDVDEAIGGELRPEISIVEGSVVGVLCGYSSRASMIVLGPRGRGGFSGLLVGSNSLSVAVHANCPVVVVRGSDETAGPDRPLVVGLDESPHAVSLAGYALAEAARRGCDVVALRAWEPSSMTQKAKDIKSAERALRGLFDRRQQDFPATRVITRVVAGGAARALVEASKSAQLVVVGSRGRGGFLGLLMGSVGQQLLHHAECPVVIVR